MTVTVMLYGLFAGVVAFALLAVTFRPAKPPEFKAGPAMGEPAKKAYELATDIVKQLITLATGIITVTITFVKDIFGIGGYMTALFAAWTIYLVSILAGLAAQMQFAGNLEREERARIYEPVARRLAAVQILLFLLATGTLTLFGVSNVNAFLRRAGPGATQPAIACLSPCPPCVDAGTDTSTLYQDAGRSRPEVDVRPPVESTPVPASATTRDGK